MHRLFVMPSTHAYMCVCQLGQVIIDTDYLFLGTAMPLIKICVVLGCEEVVLPLHSFPSRVGLV